MISSEEFYDAMKPAIQSFTITARQMLRAFKNFYRKLLERHLIPRHVRPTMMKRKLRKAYNV